MALKSSKPRLIVMPFQPETGQPYNGIGLGIHFYLGNLFAVHQGLTECWFGWRVKKIFPKADPFSSYCRGTGTPLDFSALGAREAVRYWLTGQYRQIGDQLFLTLRLTDIDGAVSEMDDTVQPDDGLARFRQRLFEWVAGCGLAFPESDAAVWHEQITIEGLDLMGRALETLYLTYVTESDPGPIDLTWFHKAVEAAPESYLTHDLKGWALCKNEAYEPAKDAFKLALNQNENGLGALAGMMWCGIYTQDRALAERCAVAKYGTRGAASEKALAFVAKKMGGQT